MSSIHSFIIERRASLTAGVISLFYFAIIGFRGFGASGLAWFDRSIARARELVDSPTAFLEWSAEPQMMADFIGALAILATPLTAGWTLVVLCALSAAISTALIFLISYRLAGPLGGWLSFFFLLTCGPWMGLFTRADPTALLVPLVLGIIIVWHSDLSWWKRTLTGSPLLAVATLLWPGALLLPAILLSIDLLVPVASRESNQSGLFSAPSVSIDRLLTPIMALLLLGLSPFFWSAPVENLGAFFLSALELPAADLVFRGQVYPPSRPPFYFGAAWLAEQLPFLTILAMGCGIAFCRRSPAPQDRRFSLSLASITVGLLLLPVFFRGPRPLGAEYVVLVVATGVPLATLVTCRFFSHALGSNSPSMKIRQVAIATFLVAGGSILLEMPAAHQAPESYRSPLTARLVGWSPATDMPQRHNILPLELLRSTASAPDQILHTGGWEKYLEIYGSMGLLSDINTTAEPERATIAIRPVTPVAAGRFVSYDSTYLVPLSNTRTRLFPGLHRPIFLIDERPDEN